jgi:hypothetical protein
VKVERALNIVGHVLASLGLGNALAIHFLEVRTLIPGEYVSPAAVLGTAWFLLCWVMPKRVIG